MRLASVLCAAAVACVSVAAASAAVRKLSFTANVSANEEASLVVSVSPRSRCTITVIYETTVSHAAGLGPKTGTKVSWRWKVGSSTHAGSWPVTVNCGKAGKLLLRLRVH